MVIRIQQNLAVEPGLVTEALRFLQAQGMVGNREGVVLEGPFAQGEVALPRGLEPVSDQDRAASLEIAFLSDHLFHNEALLKSTGVPKFLVGSAGVPSRIDHVCVPLRRPQIHAPWLRALLQTAKDFHWPVRLVHGHRGLTAREIVTLAKWFHMDSVKDALSNWLTEETRKSLSGLIEEFPGVEVRVAVGAPGSLIQEEEPGRMMILGSLHAGFWPHRNHGIRYGRILTKTGACGYFLDDRSPKFGAG